MNKLRTFRLIKSILVLFAYMGIGWMAYAKPGWILLYGILTIALGFYLLFICLTPAGSVPLGAREARMPLWQWFGAVLLGNIILLVFTIASIIAYLGTGPAFTDGALSYYFSVDILSQYTLTRWGIYPWSIYTLWGLVLAYYTYVKKGVPLYYQLCELWCPRWMQPPMKTFVEATSFTSTWFAFAFIVVAIILLCSYAAKLLLGFDHLLIPMVTISMFCFASPLFSLHWGRKLFRKLAAKKISLFGLYFIVLMILLPLVLIAGFANSHLASIRPELLVKFDCASCYDFFNLAPIADRFAAMYWAWWILWCPFWGSYVAKISEGRTIRELILGMFSVPLLILACVRLWGTGWMFTFYNWAHQPEILPIFLLSLAALCLWFLFILTCQHRFTSFFVSGVMPVSTEFRKNRLWLKDAPKIYGMSKFGSRVAVLVLTLIIMHAIGGWYIVQIQLTAMAVFTITALYWGMQNTAIQFFIDKTWIGNKNIAPMKSAYVNVAKKKYKKGG